MIDFYNVWIAHTKGGKKMSRKVVFVIIFSLVFTMFISLIAQGKKEIEKSFDPKERVKIDLVLGDCLIQPSPDNKIHIRLVYSYDDEYFEASFREKTNSLVIREKFHGENGDGFSRWTISLPEKLEVEFESATGDLNLEGVSGIFEGSSGTGSIEVLNAKGEFELNSGTGSVLVEGSEGEFELNSGTGRVKIEDCSGEFDANSGTGRVRAYNITIETEGEFNSGTGDVEVSRPQGEDFDLSVNSGTNDATVDMDGLPIEGYYEFSTSARSGDIDCPVDFDKEEEYYDGGDQVRKSFTRGKKSPRYYISTGTGTAELKR
jgi:DUF4097 and DUF4098 domain-containing protein YvlB